MNKIFLSVLLLLPALFPVQGQSWRALQQQAQKRGELASARQIILLDSTAVSVAPSGTGTFTINKVILVQNRSGALANRVLKYDYDPLTAFAEFHRVNIYKANGEVRPVDVGKTLDYTAPARMIYWGARQIMLELGRLDPGDIIEYEIHKKGFTYALLTDQPDEERFVPPMRGQFYDIVPFWCDDPTMRKVYSVTLPREKEMQFQFYQGECASSMRYENDRKVYTFAKNNMMPVRREPNMVDLYDAAPKLMMSSTPHWKDKSLWFQLRPSPRSPAKSE